MIVKCMLQRLDNSYAKIILLNKN